MSGESIRKPMIIRTTAIIVGLLAASLGYWILTFNSETDVIAVAMPTSMPVDSKAAVVSSMHAIDVSDRGDVAPEGESPVADILPAEQLSQALKASGQEVTFQVSTLLNSKLSLEVAEEMVAAARNNWLIYDKVRAQVPKSDTVACMDYFFAVWPELAHSIESGKVSVRVYPVSAHNRLLTGHVSFAPDIFKRSLAVAFHTPSWGVSLYFPADAAAPELYQQIFDTINLNIKSGR